MYADIIVDITLEKLNHTFQYAVPADMEDRIAIGLLVSIPFGNRVTNGVVIGLSSEPKYDPAKIKEIKALSKEVPPNRDLVELAVWMSDYFGATLNQCLKTTLPLRKKAKPKERKIVTLSDDETLVQEYYNKLVTRKNHSVGKERLLRELMEEREIPWDVLIDKLHVDSSHIRSLERDRIVNISQVRVFRGSVNFDKKSEVNFALNNSQRAAFDTFLENRKQGIHKPYLLYGVTGSGKTEVYLSMIDAVLKEGKQAIVLIPEIALTYQTVMRFYNRFGDVVSFINSKMSEGEKQDQIDRAVSGDCKIMIGPRSALFTPFSNLGLIIIDEEHENSYKSESAPRYHAVPTAIERARINGCDIVLGSATPSVETYYNAECGNYIMLKLPDRVMDRSMAQTEIVDLGQELRRGNRSMFSRRLVELMQDRLDHHEQIMLFLNRRGMMGSVSCRMCGTVLKCPHCDVSMSLHRDGMLHCHYCGTKLPKPQECPKCHSKMIGTMKAGTEAVEMGVRKLFPEAKVLRMDADTTREKAGHEKILSAFSDGEADILIGTQMIVKGHDFPNVTLMGVLAADLSLNVSNFRASENTFDLLVQAAGRAGRGDRVGNVVIQTYQTDHYAIESSAKQSYEEFYDSEVMFRRVGAYPPFGHLLKILIECKYENRIEYFAKNLADFIHEQIDEDDFFEKTKVLGPEDDYPKKLNDVYRKTLYLKDKNYDRLIRAKRLISDGWNQLDGANFVNIWFDYDPL